MSDSDSEVHNEVSISIHKRLCELCELIALSNTAQKQLKRRDCRVDGQQ
ncbi:hypothetical protein F441_13667 [Phytophthora nicotianae CJ01A1]|uniref:Uncharacterized protein n=5 Tax=Phytophthora nicotianae TaxID=4792 RepID=W2R8A0_PHYN3|nr:hypothetical protein PPTG_21367 [Phytophthora nicotianae INRA-310]ETI40980.1 hypothetical protein F443_13742 [Phytophthora nicotianae P1569]ETK81083.1 hypothetical protein L915_13396 [Phytophthora nicotianae]ETP10761.1 hypothetical protein F441_13667 [Phytophthora nicotianae CJ01A1]ETP38901.1 hypothetical protein F442_13593 [Phytophthora nicotianae P10297]ETL34501.1 hypothetical protein L916_13283 [Phytophthora nicotianae]